MIIDDQPFDTIVKVYDVDKGGYRTKFRAKATCHLNELFAQPTKSDDEHFRLSRARVVLMMCRDDLKFSRDFLAYR